MCPSNSADAKGLLKRAFRDENTTIFIEHTAIYGVKGEVPDNPDFLVEFGKANILRAGTDVTIVGYSGSVHQALRAAALLEEDGINTKVIDLRTLRPLDIDTVVASVKKTNRAVIVEDDWKFGGFGGELSAQIMERASTGSTPPSRGCPARTYPCPTIGTWSSPRCLRKRTWLKPSTR